MKVKTLAILTSNLRQNSFRLGWIPAATVHALVHQPISVGRISSSSDDSDAETTTFLGTGGYPNAAEMPVILSPAQISMGAELLAALHG